MDQPCLEHSGTANAIPPVYLNNNTLCTSGPSVATLPTLSMLRYLKCLKFVNVTNERRWSTGAPAHMPQ